MLLILFINFLFYFIVLTPYYLCVKKNVLPILWLIDFLLDNLRSVDAISRVTLCVCVYLMI